MNIAMMVLGFILFWPVGLAILFYNIYASPGDFDRWVRKSKDQWGDFNQWDSYNMGSHSHRRSTGNAAFDDYRTETLRRLDEERRGLEEEVRAFDEFRDELRRKRDRDEFDRFMRDQKPQRDEPTET
jgi:hypothetical protein